MKVLFYSDVHLDHTTGGVERFDEVSRALDQVHEYACNNLTRDDVAIFGGDLTDPDVDSPLCIRAISRFVAFGKDMEQCTTNLFIPGNHDVIEDGRGSHTLMPLIAAGLRVFTEPSTFFYNDVGFVLLPYTPSTRRYDSAAYVSKVASDALQGGARFSPRAWVVAGHMTRVRGVSDGSETTDMPRGGDMEFPVDEAKRLPNVVMLNGHFHERRTLYDPDSPVLIPGSLARLTHGEERNTPGFLVLEV